MNIFFLSLNVKLCAQAYYDKHVGKILLEIAQMLSTAIRLLSDCYDSDKIYRRTHDNHPMAIWVRSYQENWQWTLQLAIALHEEWCYRFQKTHKSYQVIEYISKLTLTLPSTPNGRLSFIPRCMPENCLGGKAVTAYRRYYMIEKRALASWHVRGQPTWWH